MENKRLEQIAQIAAIVLLISGCLLVLRPFVSALLVAAIVCFSSWPVYRRIELSFGGRRTLAALAMTTLLIIGIVLPVTLLAINLADNASLLIDKMRELFEQGLPAPPDWVHNLPVAGDYLDKAWGEIASSKEKFIELLRRMQPVAQQSAIRLGFALGEGAVQLSLATFIGFFFYRDGEVLVQAAHHALRRVAGDMAPGLLSTVGGTINSVIYGLIGTALAQGVAAAIGFLIAGIPGALLLGVLTFFLSMVPMGPPLLWGGATIWLFYQDQTGWAIFMGIWGVVVISGIDNVIKPLIISRGSSLPFVLVFLGVFGGVVAFGFVGIFLGPTLLAVGFQLARTWTRAAAQQPTILS